MDICTCKCQTATFENVCTVDNQSVSPIFLNFSLFSSYYLYKFCPFASLLFPLHLFFRFPLSLSIYFPIVNFLSTSICLSGSPSLSFFLNVYFLSPSLCLSFISFSPPPPPQVFGRSQAVARLSWMTRGCYSGSSLHPTSPGG